MEALNPNWKGITMEKTFTIEEIKEAMEQEIRIAVVEVERDFDAKLDNYNSGYSWEELLDGVMMINSAKRFEKAVLRRLEGLKGN